ncbi:hypothetical protein BpHYR1_005956 [Brachionus plicatilis]|uniref:Uncharacterized protein n=1 Tax=Brachionus plicatilis TaxID=10195 RepID=A0A3M7PBE8_BRAPC|nr:hypothetical protein BpHYR1_005956 [Brachionus plicatilis]
MEKLRKEIIEYNSNLINEIDIKCEKAILFFKTEETIQRHFMMGFHGYRIIAKIKFYPRRKISQIMDIMSQEKTQKFKFIVHLGQLIVCSSLRPDDFKYSRVIFSI